MIRAGHIQIMLAGWLGLVTLVTFVLPEHTLLFTALSGVIGLAVAAFLFPGAALILGMVSTAITVEFFLFFQNFNLNNQTFLGSSSFHKVISLALMLPAIVRYGFKPKPNPLLLVFLVMFGCTMLGLSSRLPALDNAQVIQTLVGLGMPYVVFNMRLKERWIDSHLAILASLPFLSVFLGLIAQALGILDTLGRPWEVYGYEPTTGANRLSGINIAAYLAAFSFIAFVIAIYQAVLYGKKGYYWVAGAILVITVFTGTRGPLACEILFAGLGILISSNRDLRASAKVNFGIIGAVMLGVIMIAYWPNLQARFSGGGGGEVINTSSRTMIWDIEYKAFEVNPVFGRGLGAGAIILLDEDWENIKQARATHNEYLRLLVDGGVVGLGGYLVGLLILLITECRGVSATAARLTFALFLSFAIYSFTDNTISSASTMNFFYAIALLLFQARLAGKQDRSQAPAFS